MKKPNYLVGLVLFLLFVLNFSLICCVSADTVGLTSVGVTNEDFGAGSQVGFNLTVSGSIDVYSVHLYIKRLTAEPVEGSLALAIYNATAASLPDCLLVSVSGITFGQSAGWVYGNVSITLAAGEYWVVLLASQSFSVYYDTSSVFGRSWDDGNTYPIFNSPFVSDGSHLRVVSGYLSYNETPVVTPSPSPSPSPSPIPSSTSITDGELSFSFLFVLGFMVSMCILSLTWFVNTRGGAFVGVIIGLFTVLIGLYAGLGGVYSLGVVQGWFSLFVALFGGLTMLLVGLGVRVKR